MRQRGSATSSQPDLFPPGMLTTATSATCIPTTFGATSRCTASLASAAGHTLPGSSAGPTTVPSGPAPLRASLFPWLAEVSAPTTNGICGPTSFASSVPPGPLSSWESRLRDRLATVGSTEFALIWRVRATPAGRLISRLAPWTPPTSAAGSTGSPWPTPTANDFLVRDLDRLQARRQAMKEAHRNGNGFGLTLGQAMMLATWPPPKASDGAKGSPRQAYGTGGGTSLPTQMHAAWATPAARDWRSDRSRMSGEALYGTKGRPLARQMLDAAEAPGLVPTGSPATTESRGVPHPAFPCWLMGFPAAWLCGAGSATRSARRLRPKS